jgi:acylphosphatase
MGSMADQTAIAATITGRVQGVGYRYAVLHMAGELGLKGWVRNAPDGSVETWAQGNADVLQVFIAFLKQGPRSARVQSVDVRSVVPDASLHGFVVRS